MSRGDEVVAAKRPRQGEVLMSAPFQHDVAQVKVDPMYFATRMRTAAAPRGAISYSGAQIGSTT